MLAHTETEPRIFTETYYARLEEIEAEHWWYRGLRWLSARWLAQEFGNRGAVRVLDVGCGAGYMLRWLERYAHGNVTVGLDYDARALNYARRHGRGVVVQGSAMELPFSGGSFDLVCCLDVLQHLPTTGGGSAALVEIGRVLAPRGLLVVRTNAQPGLGSAGEHDPIYQRYRLDLLEQQVRDAGLTVLRSTHVNVLPSLVATARLYARPPRHHTHDHVQQRGPGIPHFPRLPGVNAMMSGLLALEALALSLPAVASPFGHSAMVLARRP